jgi:hypothetical protein
MKLSHIFLAALAVWMSAVGALASPTEVLYKLSVQEMGDNPAGLGDITPGQRAELVSEFNDNLVPDLLE